MNMDYYKALYNNVNYYVEVGKSGCFVWIVCTQSTTSEKNTINIDNQSV